MSNFTRARPAPLPPDEIERLALLQSYCVLDTPPEPIFEDLTALAAKLFDVPIVLISLVDEHRQFFKSVVGLSITETSRKVSFCAYALLDDVPLIVPDACEDERFRENPLVTGEPFIRFYAGAPLVAEGGLKLGTFCIIDRKPRSDFESRHYEDLQRFAALTSKLIEQRLLPGRVASAEEENTRLENRMGEVLESTSDSVVLLNEKWEVTFLNRKATQFLADGEGALGQNVAAIFPKDVANEEVWALLHRTMGQQIPTCFESSSTGGAVLEVHSYPILDGIALFVRDVTERSRMEGELRSAHERFVLATRATTEGIWDYDRASETMYYSARWRAMLGLPPEEVVGSTEDWSKRVHPSDYPRAREIWNALPDSHESMVEAEFRCRHEDGSWCWLLVRAICQREPDGALLRVAGSATDITARRTIDPLTGLHNRTSLLEHLQWRIDRQGDHLSNYGLLFLDIDSFKRINDSLGHLRGDALLEEVSLRLEQTVKGAPGSLVSRLGGDEFVILAGDLESEEDALTYADSLKCVLEAPVNCMGQQVFISASIGVAFGRVGTYTEAEQMLEDADVAMYRAKLNGKAQSALFSQAMREEAVLRLQFETDLRTALEADQFELHYQPKITLDTGQVKGFEALIRWRHPKRGLIAPGDFIPLAEQTGLISEIGRWVGSEAILQLARWRREGAVDADVAVAVNISTKQIDESDLLDFFTEQLRIAGLPPECLVLEVTESIFAEDSPTGLHLLHGIVAAGIGLDLDDFGTGFSSLSYLHRFPFRSVKIDRSFVSRMSTDPKSVSLVASILGLAGSLKMGVIAEGVETQEQARLLQGMGCAVAQGYLFSAPRPVSELGGFMNKNTRFLDMPRTSDLMALPARETLHGLAPALNRSWLSR